jgi:palmitoyl-protein thioesterase
MFSNDTMIFPKETSWFHQYQADGTILPVTETDFYKNDNIGLKVLNEAGKVKFEEFPGDHLQFTDEQVHNIIVPFLK